MNQSKNPATQAGTLAANSATETKAVPAALGWEKPNQRWSGFWFIAFLLMIPVDLAAAYFIRGWGIFQWIPGLALGGYTLGFFLHIFIPYKADLRTPEEKLAEDNATQNDETLNQPGISWSFKPWLEPSPAGDVNSPFEDN